MGLKKVIRKGSKCKFCKDKDAVAVGWFHKKQICIRCWRKIKGGYKFS